MSLLLTSLSSQRSDGYSFRHRSKTYAQKYDCPQGSVERLGVSLSLPLGNLFWFLRSFQHFLFILRFPQELCKSFNIHSAQVLSEDAYVSSAKTNFLLLFPLVFSFPYIFSFFSLTCWTDLGLVTLPRVSTLLPTFIISFSLWSTFSELSKLFLPYKIIGLLLWLFRWPTEIFIFVVLF